MVSGAGTDKQERDSGEDRQPFRDFANERDMGGDIVQIGSAPFVVEKGTTRSCV